MSMKRTITLVFLVAAVGPVGPAFGEVVWSDSQTFSMDMLCQDPSDTGLVSEDSLLYTLDMLCQDPSGSGLSFGDGGVFVLQFADLDGDEDIGLSDHTYFADNLNGPGG